MKKTHDKLIFELTKPGRVGYSLPLNTLPFSLANEIPAHLLREIPTLLPEVSELDVVRHYTNLSMKNFGVETGFYPLGSCTMKYNPKLNEEIANMSAFSNLHPLTSEANSQGILEIYYETSKMLSEVTGMAEFSFAPFAGAHGELVGLMMIVAYHKSRGDFKRTKVIVPDSAHGTNPASATMCGLDIIEVKSNEYGTVDVEDLKRHLSDEVAAIMLTNPNTLGIFEKDIMTINKLIHDCGALSYYDGANLNAVMGVVKPSDMGFDVMHLNLHKTFSTPHGGGGPGSGTVGANTLLAPFLPNPRVIKVGVAYKWADASESIGRVSRFYGNILVMLRAYVYLKTLGHEHAPNIAKYAVLSANYMRAALKDEYLLPITGLCKHEVVFQGLKDKSTGVTTLDVAKRLLDYGYHPPTIYFPLIIKEALMIEPTEVESLETLDAFIRAMKEIAKEAKEQPELVKSAPHTTIIRRIDEVLAARRPIVKFQDLHKYD